MPKSIKILLTLAVILFTALNIYRVELKVPIENNPNDPEDLLYKAYMIKHSVILSVFVVGNMLVWFTGYLNRVIRSCLLMNASVFAYIIFKISFLNPEKHYFFDWTVLGGALLYLVYPYLKETLSLCKAIINQMHQKWQMSKSSIKKKR